MDDFRIQTKLIKDGKLSIDGLPFRKGEVVEVIVKTQKQTTLQEKYPLRGKPFGYREPFESIAEKDWEALK